MGKDIAVFFAFQGNFMWIETNLGQFYPILCPVISFFSAYEQGYYFIVLSVHIALQCHNYIYHSTASYVKHVLHFYFIRYRNFHYHKRKYCYMLSNISTSKVCHLQGQYDNARKTTAQEEIVAVFISLKVKWMRALCIQKVNIQHFYTVRTPIFDIIWRAFILQLPKNVQKNSFVLSQIYNLTRKL